MSISHRQLKKKKNMDNQKNMKKSIKSYQIDDPFEKIYLTMDSSEIRERYREVMYNTYVFRRNKDIASNSFEATLKCDGTKLTLNTDKLFSNDLNIRYGFSVVLANFFDTYDMGKKLLNCYSIKNIDSYLIRFLQDTRKIGITIKIDFTVKNILRFIVKNESAENIDKYKELYKKIEYQKEDVKLTSIDNNLYDTVLVQVEELKRRHHVEVVKKIKQMDEGNGFVNIYENDERVKNIKEETSIAGLIRSINELGKVDIQFISKITNKSMKETITTLKGYIYQNPETWKELFYEGFETAEEYLSGNLMKKLNIAKKANEEFIGCFGENIKAIKKCIDKRKPVTDFNISLGSPWVPENILSMFFEQKIYGKKDLYDTDIIYSEEMANAKRIKKINNKSFYKKYSALKANVRYGFTKYDFKNEKQKYFKEISPVDVFENLINNKYNYAKYDDYKIGKTMVDEAMTLVVRKKEENMQNDFKEFIMQPSYYNLIQKIYNEKFGYYYKREFDYNFLNFQNMNTALTLYPHQKRAIARIVLSKNTLLAHQVGSGKTYVMIVAGMELKRMGISKKNLYVVPNNILGQWHKMFLYAYPDSNVLLIDNKKFKKDTINDYLSLIKENDWDAIIMPYSSFDRIESKSLLNKYNIDNSKLYFEDLGITTLFVDEAHNYKNVPISTILTNVLGLNIGGSKKCLELMSKCRYVQNTNNGRGLVFATGTPITNTISDLYNVQKYLQNDDLKELGLDTFDAWRGMFATITSNFEVDVDTQKYRLADRFGEYHNVTELNDILAQIIDYHELDSNNNVIPDYDGYNDILIEKDKSLNDYLLSIADRVDNIRAYRVKREEDNMLKVTVDGRKAALDMRIIDENIKFNDKGKIASCVDNVSKIYFENQDKLSTQVIFCDISISHQNKLDKEGEDRHFSVYDELKRQLVNKNIPEKEIAFIHDANSEKQKMEIYDDFNSGKLRVLIGSTFKLGMGVNIQKKLIALHHLDVPWRPSDMTQREGRILREGNENKKVYIYRYITKGTFDAYSWQILETKQKFITQILSSQLIERSIDEVDDTILNYAEAKALACGNQLIKEKFELSNQLNKLELLKSNFVLNREMQLAELKSIPIEIEKNNERIKKIKLDIDKRNKYRIEKNKTTKEDKEEIAQKIYEKLFESSMDNEESEIMVYKGFTIYTVPSSDFKNLMLKIKGADTYYVKVDSEKSKYIDRMDRVINSFDDTLDDLYNKNEKLANDEIYIKNNLNNQFTSEDEITILKKKINEIDVKLSEM